MRINTAASIELGRRVHRRFGSWEAARNAAYLRDGAYILPPERGSIREIEGLLDLPSISGS
jgi:hypothetical protein